MGSQLAHDEAQPTIPTWMLENVLEIGTWDAAPTGWRGPLTHIEKVLVREIVKARGKAAVLEAQLNAVEGL